MALKPIRPRLRNISNDVAKVQITIPAGDEIEVSEEVAAQLAHQGAPMRDVAAPKAKAADPEPEAEGAPAPKRSRKAAD